MLSQPSYAERFKAWPCTPMMSNGYTRAYLTHDIAFQSGEAEEVCALWLKEFAARSIKRTMAGIGKIPKGASRY